MSIFLEEEGRVSSRCHRKKHSLCSSSKRLRRPCNCNCHFLKEKQEEKEISDLQILDDNISLVFRRLFN